jgi:CRISPR-associated protein Csy3
MATENLKTASVLAFERKLDPSDALFHQGSWAERDRGQTWPAVVIHPKSVRGTISNRLKTKDQDPAKLDAAIENPNLQTVDVAALSHEADTLKVQFTLRVLAGTGTPSACNDAAYQQRLRETVQSYVKANGFGELAKRYAFNLANARWLWRNRIGVEQVEVRVAHLVDGQPMQAPWVFDALSLSLRDFDPGANAKELGELAALVQAGLEGRQHVLLQVTACVRVGAGQEVFPSQELILDRGRGDKSKTLYCVGPKDNAIAAIHSQKIGNALRTIDTWYPDADELGPIAVEPYGSVTTQGKAYRQPKAKADFYTLLDNWVLKGVAPSVGDQHYVLAVLVRGGVFGEAG